MGIMTRWGRVGQEAGVAGALTVRAITDDEVIPSTESRAITSVAADGFTLPPWPDGELEGCSSSHIHQREEEGL